MKKQSFLKGVILLTAAGIIVKFIGFVYRVVLTNLPGYGDEGNGIYGAGFQVYLILYAISTTGFPAAISRMVAEKMAQNDWRGAHKVFKVSLVLLSITGFLFSMIFFLCSEYIAKIISNERTVYTMIALSPTIFFVSLMAVFRGYFQGMRDMSPQANSQIIEQVAKTAATVILAYLLLPYGVEIAAAGATLGTTIGAAVGAAYLVSLYNRRKKELWSNIRRFCTKKKQDSVPYIIKNLFKVSIPVSLGALIVTAANIIDLATVMSLLSKAGIDSESANRLYGILTGKCYVLVNFPVAVSMALATSLVPTIAGSKAIRDYKSVRDKINASLRLTILIGLPSSAGMAILADPILKMLFPGSSEGAYLLSISAFIIVFMGMTQTLSGILQGLGKVLVPTVGLFTGALVKLVINFSLMPLPGINIRGAVYGTLLCYIVSTVINMIALKRNFRLNLDIYNLIIKPVVATVIMSVFTYFAYYYLYMLTASNFISTMTTILISAAVFGMLVLALRVVRIEEISVLPFGENVNRIFRKMKLYKRR